MKLYLAGRYPRRDEFRALLPLLEFAGVEITSRWLTETERLDHNMGDHSIQFYRKTARIDLDDIDAADGILFFSENPKVGIPRGGRHVEFGYALATGKMMIVIGDYENIFHYLPQVIHYPDLEAFLDYARSIAFLDYARSIPA
jgi:nucleoside 2-deoxyribosyltransferase